VPHRPPACPSYVRTNQCNLWLQASRLLLPPLPPTAVLAAVRAGFQVPQAVDAVPTYLAREGLEDIRRGCLGWHGSMLLHSAGAAGQPRVIGLPCVQSPKGGMHTCRVGACQVT
jgi:hypothetical protein